MVVVVEDRAEDEEGERGEIGRDEWGEKVFVGGGGGGEDGGQGGGRTGGRTGCMTGGVIWGGKERRW